MENQVLNLKDKYKAHYGIKLSRNEKRRAIIELKIFEIEVETLINAFESDLFQDNLDDYNYLYKMYLENITKLCDWLNKYRFKIIQVDNYFFSETYKPLEFQN